VNRVPIPGKDGGWAENVQSRCLPQLARQTNPEAKQLPGPSAHRRWVGQPVWFFGVRNRVFPTGCFAQRLPGLLPAMETIVPVRRRPCGQDREGFPARPTQPAANPDPLMPPIVRLFAPPSVTDDSSVAADRTASRQMLQWDCSHPGSVLSSASGSAIKRIKAGVKARPFQRPAKVRLDAGLHPPGKDSVSNEKK
jgi:hypothetical protein